MDAQDILAEAQARADSNGDGKLNVRDLDALRQRYKLDETFVDELKTRSDANGDGKVEVNDLKAGLGNFRDMFTNSRNKLFGA